MLWESILVVKTKSLRLPRGSSSFKFLPNIGLWIGSPTSTTSIRQHDCHQYSSGLRRLRPAHIRTHLSLCRLKSGLRQLGPELSQPKSNSIQLDHLSQTISFICSHLSQRLGEIARKRCQIAPSSSCAPVVHRACPLK